MYLYNLTLQKPTGIHQAVHGNFSGTKSQEIVISRGRVLELLKPDPNTGKVHTMLSVEVFGVIRSMMSFRLTGSTKDYIVVGSDSGRVVILEYKPDKNVFEKLHQETYGKSGCRRIVPGQYLAMDPKGRAIMIGAVEKQKLVYILNRDHETKLTISSPLEAHKSNTFVYHIVGVDVGFENAMFACLEIDYEDADSDPTGQAVLKTQQTLTFYELDFGLNHVVRKYSEVLEERANFLLTVPGGDDGPSGVLICSENYITYKNLGDQPDIRCPIPRRRNDLDDPERGMIFICSAMHKTKSKAKTMFFFLTQTEQGDIFKITLECVKEMVVEIKMKYFDTVPPSSAMCVLKTGFLFVASEFGNHSLYQIAHLGDDDDEPEFSSAMPLQEGDTFFFQPRELKNLVLVDELESLSPIISCKVADLANEDTPQLYMLCGRSSRSTLRVLRHGLEVTEMAVSELPGSPNAVWTVKRRSDNEFDSYIILSFPNATLVLSIGETVEEVTDSGFLGTTPTLACSSLGKDVLIQIYADGIRHIRSDRRVNEWKTPHKKHIVKCAINQTQVVIALSGGDLIYFEMDPSGKLNEHKESKRMPDEVLCMAVPLVTPGEQRSWFLAVGLADSSIRILSLDPSDCLSFRSTIAFPVTPESLIIVRMGAGDSEDMTMAASSSLYLYVGLHNGALQRTLLDPVTGDLTDTRIRYLGSKPVKLFRVFIQGFEAVLAMSSRTWLSYYFQNRFFLTPLSYQSLEYASGFSSEQCPEGIVAISANTLRILALEKLGAVFNQISYPLEYTPRKFLIHPNTNYLMIVETDHNAFTEKTKKERRVQLADEMKAAAEEEEEGEDKETAMQLIDSFLNDDLPESTFSSPKAGLGMWASQIRIMDPLQGKTTNFIKFEQNEAALSLVLLKFTEHSEHHWYLVVGIVKDFHLNPRQFSSGALLTYKVDHMCRRFDFIHRTPVDESPNALCAYHGRLLVGLGKLLILYQFGKKKLLKKCENKYLPNMIVDIQVIGSRIFVCDVQESVFVVRYKKIENQLVIFADDTNPRFITCATILDYDTIAVGDKFGNISVFRLPNETNDDLDDDPTGTKSLWDRGLLSGAAQKFEIITNFHVGETVTALQKATLIPGGQDSLVYVTLSGMVGTVGPLSSAEDHDFFQNLELHMRSEQISLVGRDHLSYRSAYYPVKNVIDGDLCEQYTLLDYATQRNVANDLEKTPAEVCKKLEDIRTRYAF